MPEEKIKKDRFTAGTHSTGGFLNILALHIAKAKEVCYTIRRFYVAGHGVNSSDFKHRAGEIVL